MIKTYLSCLLVIFTFSLSQLNAQERGILNKKAPSWDVQLWHNLPESKTTLDISDYTGKVVYLYCFQSWCPGCHRYGFPTLQKLIQHYSGNEDVAFVTVQTTFEGHSTNTFEKAKNTAQRYELSIPVGQSNLNNKYPLLMVDYRTGGTPWTIIIDQEGVVRYNDFHIKPAAAQQLIDKLVKEAP